MRRDRRQEVSGLTAALNVSQALKNPGQQFPFEARLEIAEMVIFSDTVLLEDVRAEGELLATDDGRVSVRARASATVRTHCSRCLEELTAPVEAELDALFSRTPDPEDPDLYGFEGYSLDLTDAVRDALVLELPMRFLCKPDCKGLCPICGANRNVVACTCQEGGNDTNPFSALKNIVLNDEEV